jgi:predicted amidohydrolase
MRKKCIDSLEKDGPMKAMERYRVTVGQLVLSNSRDVYYQINRTFDENPGSDLFVFPEFATQDNIHIKAVDYLQGNPEAKAAALKWLNLVPMYSEVKALTERSGKAILIGSIAQEERQLFSRATYYDPQDQQVFIYDKTHVHWTEEFLRPGTEIEAEQTRFGKIGTLICYDLAFVEPTRVLGIKGAELLIVPAAIPADFHWRYPHYRMIGAAIFNQYYVLAAHLGHSDGAPMGGHSAIYSPEGDRIAHIDGADYGYISAEIDLRQVTAWREKEMISPYRKPHLYQPITEPVQNH